MSLDLLDQVVPGLAARVRALPPERRRRLAVAAATVALAGRPVADPRVDGAWAAVRGEGDREAAAASLQQLVDALDDESALLQMAHDESVERGRPDEQLRDAYVRTFERARACAALLAALEPDVDDAVAGALYDGGGALAFPAGLLIRLVDAAAAGAEDPATGIEP